MIALVWISLFVNVLVLVPVCAGLAFDSAGMAQAFGQDTPARRILLSLYLMILIASILIGGLLAFGHSVALTAAMTLLLGQVIYKVMTAGFLGAGHPVVRANLAISALHSVTLASLWVGKMNS